ncbi:unnamed protein product [Cladocopium goreaui]|uniref:Uncharacterized protein n=1 Tax=Cladocopium goreaui TaxID=2562237 RepID=A0A9P1CU00_9DINO|nr:unnamed protein product [Cladocopium goreaui]
MALLSKLRTCLPPIHDSTPLWHLGASCAPLAFESDANSAPGRLKAKPLHAVASRRRKITGGRGDGLLASPEAREFHRKPPPRICSSAMTQQVQPAKQCESSPNTKQMKETLSEVKGQHEKAAQIRKSFQRPKFWVMGFGWCLAACAGAANVIAFKSWNLYASHVTGSTSAMAFRLEGYHQGEYGSESLKEACLLVFSFLCGAYACGLLIDKNQVHFMGKAFYGLALILNSSLLVTAAFIPGRLLPVCLVAAACGLQNAMCTSHFGAIIRTTHVTGTVTDIGSTLGRISMIYIRKGCRCSKLDDVERAEVGVDARKLAVLFGLWSFYFMGGLFGVYMENIIPGPPQRALLLPATFTGSVGLFYMACRQILKDYIKKLERERFEADLKEAHDVLAHMGSRLHDLERNDQSVVELDAEMGHMIEALHEVEADFENLVRTHSQMLERQEISRTEDSAASKSDKAAVSNTQLHSCGFQLFSNFLLGLSQKLCVFLCIFSAMTQQVQPAQCESSPNTKKMKETLGEVKGQHEKAAQIRKSFQRPKFWVTGFGWCLAACAGAANVIAFKSWNLYASHVTGSTSEMAFRLEGYHQGEYGSESLKEASLLVFSFLCGAYACGLLIDKNQVHFMGKAFYGLALVLNSSLLVTAAFIPGSLLPVCLVSAACGLQNAMCTSHFGAIIRTTHVTGTVTDIGSTLGRISMIYIRKGCRCSKLDDVERAEVGVDARKLAVLFGLWSFYFMGGLFGVYMENIIPGPPQRALLLPATFTGSVGLFYMACRQILKDYIKKLERERFEADLKEAHDVLVHMGNRLQSLEQNDQSVVELDAEMGHMIEALHEVEADFENLVRTHSRMLERTESAASKPDKV